MSRSTLWGVFAAVLAVFLGAWLQRAGTGMRLRRGLGSGKTISLDNLTLRSHRLGLVGRPDRLVNGGGTIVPEEWKSSQRPRPWHRAQLGVYFLLTEDRLGVRPPHGFIVCGNGERHRVENTDELPEGIDHAPSLRRRSSLAGLDASIQLGPIRAKTAPASFVRVLCAP